VFEAVVPLGVVEPDREHGVAGEHQPLGRAAAEEGAGTEVGRIHRDHLQAKNVAVELDERSRVPRAEADVTDTDHLRRFLLRHGLSVPLDENSGMVFLLAGGEPRPARVRRRPTLLIGNDKGVALRFLGGTCLF
jgi:hypothetical protein